MPLSAGGRCNCPRVRALSALAWWVDGALLAWRVDGGLTGLASRRGLLGGRGLAADPQYARVIWSAPAVRSAATAHAPPTPARSRGYHPSTPPIPHRTTNCQSRSGATSTGPGGYHNRRPTGGVLPYSKLMRCNDYPTSAAPADATREANPQTGFLGKAATRRRRREERAAFEEISEALPAAE